MKLNKGDRINYNNSIYEVIAVLWSTIYLREVEDCSNENSNCYKMEEVQKHYKDIEFIGGNEHER